MCGIGPNNELKTNWHTLTSPTVRCLSSCLLGALKGRSRRDFSYFHQRGFPKGCAGPTDGHPAVSSLSGSVTSSRPGSVTSSRPGSTVNSLADETRATQSPFVDADPHHPSRTPTATALPLPLPLLSHPQPTTVPLHPSQLQPQPQASHLGRQHHSPGRLSQQLLLKPTTQPSHDLQQQKSVLQPLSAPELSQRHSSGSTPLLSVSLQPMHSMRRVQGQLQVQAHNQTHLPAPVHDPGSANSFHARPLRPLERLVWGFCWLIDFSLCL
jgi:hypothetical protein